MIDFKGNIMKHRIKNTVCLFTGIMLVFCLTTASALDEAALLNDLLEGIETRYSRQGFSTDFIQLSTLQALDITETATGTAYFSFPGKMRWEYKTPDVHQIITNSKILWIYRQQDNQVIQGNADKLFKAGAGGAFLSDISLIRKNFDMTLREITPEQARINMISKTNDPDVSSIVITVDRQSHEIQQVITYNVYEDTTRFDFSNIRFLPFDEALFEFKIPENTDIIYMND